MAEGILEQSFAGTAIEPERHFFQIGGEMLDAETMPCSYDAALEQRERAFDRVGMNVARNINVPMRDGFVGFLPLSIQSPWVDSRFVGNKHLYGVADVLADDFCNRRRFGVFGAEQPQLPIALPDADNHVFFASWAIDSRLPAQIGFVDLNNAIERGFLRFQHGRADAMAEIPRRFVSADFQDALNLQRGDTLFRLREQERCDEPFSERQMGVVKYCSRCDGELRLASAAPQHGFSPLHTSSLFLSAFRADWAGRPTELLQVFPALAFAIELRHKFMETNARKSYRRHGHSPMKKRNPKRKSDRQVLKEIFPPEIVKEVDATLEDLDSKRRVYKNPHRKGAKPIKPWGRKWVEEKLSE